MNKVTQGDYSVYVEEQHGDINTFILPENIPHELVQPPVKPDFFIGRDKDLEDLRKKILNGDSLLFLVNGHGGVGKSTLAARYYHEYKVEYEHVAWLLSEKSISNALLRLKDKLGFTPDQNKLTIDEQLEVMITKLANLKKTSLLVIDNANELTDLQQNYLALKRCSNLHVLLTTRITEYDGVPCFKVEGLSEPFAMELFKKHYPNHKEEENELLKEIIKNLDNNTLIIELLAKNLKELNLLESQYTLHQLAEDLHQSLLKLSKSHKISTSYQAKSHKLRVEKPEDIVKAMYDFKKLSEAEKQMISVFAILPNEAIHFDFIKQSFPGQNIKPNVSSIAQKGWVDFNKKEKLFKVNQVIQDVAFENQKDRLYSDCKPMIKKLGNHLTGDDILHKNQFLLTQLMVNYAESIASKIPDENLAIAILHQSLGLYYSKTGDVTNSLNAYNRMNTIFQKLRTSDLNNEDFKNGLAISYEKLGETHTALGNLDKALTYFEDRSKLGKELYDAYPQNVSFKNGLAISYEKLGSTHTALGNLDKALTYFEKDIELSKELYEAYPQNVSFKNGLAISYSKLGETHTALGNLDKALTYFEDRSKLGKELYDAYPQNVSFKNGLAISYEKLGSTHTALGNLDKALTYFEDETVLFEELYEAYPQNVSFKNGLAISYSKLGETHTALGNLDKALTYFEDETVLFEELYEAYPQNVSFKYGLAISYEKLGSTHTALGNLDKALTYFEKDIELSKELYEAYPQNVSFKNGLAISYAKLGVFHRDNLKDIKEAKLCFSKAQSLWKELVQQSPRNKEFERYHNQINIDLDNLHKR